MTEWRTRTLNGFLTIAAVVLSVGVIALFAVTLSKPGQLPAALIFLACDLLLIGLAAFRRIDSRWRGMGFLLLGYVGGILTFSRSGLAGAGRETLIVLPVIAIILINLWAGLALAAFSVSIMVAFAVLARQGVIQAWLDRGWLIYAQNPLGLEAWVVEETYTALLLAITVGLLVLFYRFWVKTLEGERQARVELNQAGQLLGEYSQSLEHKVEQRTAELVRATDEAIEARSVAEAASRAKSEFLANMSHEIRTPLNAIVGMTGLLFESPLSPQQQEFVQTIRESSDSLLAIINDILDYSKIESGRLELEHHAFNLQECMESALDIVAPAAAAKGLELVCAIEPGTPRAILGDSTRLRQVLVNLLSNAVKFTEQGEVVVSARRETEPYEEGDAAWSEPAEVHSTASILHFSVRDTGIGIPQERTNRLFHSFSQVDASTTRKYSGTGLGLAISKRLSEMMEGAIWVESQVGRGSIFHFTIRARPTELPSPSYMAVAQPQLSGKRILIVDDNPTNRQIMLAQTRGWGMIPEAAASGDEALDLLRQADGSPFDLAILDLQMPEMDGLKLAEAIRQQEKEERADRTDRLSPPQNLPLVMLTSLGWQESDPRRREFTAFLTKPVKASQLYYTLVNAFASGVLLAPPAQAPVSPQPAVASSVDTRMAERLPLRILLAEDNSTNQKLALLMLERMGYRADVSANGLEVLEALHRQRYDVILMDVQMPELDGLDATRQIRSEFPAQHQPYIIAMTANVTQGDDDRCLEAGMNDYLGKPIRLEALAQALARAGTHVGSARTGGIQAGEARTGGNSVSTRAAPAGVSSPSGGATLEEVLDPAAWSRLRLMLGIQAGEMLPMLIDTFLEEAVQLHQDACWAVEENRPDDLRRAAHTLKSNAANFGATALAATCLELENVGRKDTVDGATDLLVRLEKEFEQVKSTLLAMREHKEYS